LQLLPNPDACNPCGVEKGLVVAVGSLTQTLTTPSVLKGLVQTPAVLKGHVVAVGSLTQTIATAAKTRRLQLLPKPDACNCCPTQTIATPAVLKGLVANFKALVFKHQGFF